MKSKFNNTFQLVYLTDLAASHNIEILKTQEKFYLADTSLRYSVLGYQADTFGQFRPWVFHRRMLPFKS